MKKIFFPLFSLFLLVNCHSFPTHIATTIDNKKLSMDYIFDYGPYSPGIRKEYICDAKTNDASACKNVTIDYGY